jgi:hypothetical protein
MKTRAIASTAAAAALLLAGACSDDGGDDATGGGQPAGQSESTQAPEPSTSEPGSGDPDATGTDDPSEDTSETTEATTGPQDQDLDIELRNLNGVGLRVSRLSFEEGDIFVDAEVVNSSTYDITFHPGNGVGFALRLEDDAGNVYNFVEPEGTENQAIDVASGETVNGTFAFRGPLRGEPEQLTLVTNLYDEDIPRFDIDDEFSPANELYQPGFVVPIELDWA